jgi:hypothetical protein
MAEIWNGELRAHAVHGISQVYFHEVAHTHAQQRAWHMPLESPSVIVDHAGAISFCASRIVQCTTSRRCSLRPSYRRNAPRPCLRVDCT